MSSVSEATIGGSAWIDPPVDIVSTSKRSEMMSRVRSSNTRPELLLRSQIHQLGFRFRVNVSTLPGKPDLVFPKFRTAVFVHGCFWHQHRNCRRATLPSTRATWWKTKLEGNVLRDKASIRKLRRSGWTVVVVWECQIERNPGLAATSLARKLRSKESCRRNDATGRSTVHYRR